MISDRNSSAVEHSLVSTHAIPGAFPSGLPFLICLRILRMLLHVRYFTFAKNFFSSANCLPFRLYIRVFPSRAAVTSPVCLSRPRWWLTVGCGNPNFSHSAPTDFALFLPSITCTSKLSSNDGYVVLVVACG